MRKGMKTRAVVGVLAAAVIAAPARASGAPAEQVLPTSSDPGTLVAGRPGAPPPHTLVDPDGFDWEDAGIGGAGVLSLLGFVTGVAVIGRCSRGDQAAVG